MHHGHFGITTNDLLTWQVVFAKHGTLPPEVQRRLLEAQVRQDFNSHNGPIVVPASSRD